MKSKAPALAIAISAGMVLFILSIKNSQHHKESSGTNAPSHPSASSSSLYGRHLKLSGPTHVDTPSSEIFDRIDKLEKGQLISLPTPDGKKLEARLNYVRTFENGAAVTGGRLTGDKSIFQIAREAWGYRGFVLQRDEGIAYVYGTDDSGKLTVARRPIGEVICEPNSNWEPLAKSEKPDPEKIPIYNGGRSVGVLSEPIPILHSLPRAKATIYLDFDGEVIEGQAWEGGEQIIAPAFAFTQAEITDIWEKVAEDYAPFEVNVTTDLQAYLQAPLGLRIRCITTSNNFAGAGGVAFTNTFRQSDDICCWNFDPNSGAAVVISHEVGHTFGLHHDDTTTQGYYGGHNNWGPIMGAPYGREVTQWSKGDYNNANQHQDDLAFIGASVPERHDFHRASTAGATPLTIGLGGEVTNDGIIENRYDIDRFIFTTGGGTIELHFENADNSPNLDIEAKLYDSGGTLLATSSPSNQLTADLSEVLATGTYTVTVDGVGNGTWAADGYDDYGSMGKYYITGTIPSPGWRFHISSTAVDGAQVGTVDPGAGSSYSITSGNTGSAFAIDSSTGLISVADASALTPGTTFNLQVDYNAGGATSTTVIVDVPTVNGLKYELWTDLGGGGIGAITGNPDQTGFVSTFQAVYPADNYGQRLSGYLVPDETGDHVFWTTADDASELWLSTDDDPANKVRIAYNNSNAAPDEWTKFGSQESAPIPLVAGQRYYIEFLSRENAGGDHSSAVWQTPSRPRQLISTDHLEVFDTPVNRAPWLASRTYRVQEDRTSPYEIAVLERGDYEPGSMLSQFTIVGGNTDNAFAIDSSTGALRVNGPLSFADFPKYLLDVSVTDSGGLTTTAQIAVEVEPLAVKREYYLGISGNTIADLTSNPAYPDSPTLVNYESHFEAPQSVADEYGQRLSGFIRAPDTGSYTFWIASDDHGELWLSTDTDPANKVRIAYHSNHTNSRQWDKYPTQQSESIQLESGQFYYIEAIHKEGAGVDNLAVAWSGPNFSQMILGAPHVTQQFYNHGAPEIASDASATILDTDTSASIATLEATDWFDPGTTIRFSITDGNDDGAFAIDEVTGEVTLVGGPITAGVRVLTVAATDNSPTPLAGTATVTVTIEASTLKREIWTNLSGGTVAGLTAVSTFPGQPNISNYVSDFETTSSWGENYGQRVSGFLIPAITGDYTFWIASDDSGELWLSSDMNPANRQKICEVNGSVSPLDWTAQANQQSTTIPLVAGQRYYIEALHKENEGNDHLAVAWQGPGFSRRVIESERLHYPDQFHPGLTRELWYGGDWNNFPDSSTADFTGTILEAKAPQNIGDNYLQRLSGYLVPPATGDYYFWIASDDDGILSLSTDDDPANLEQIASVSGSVSPENWDAKSSQISSVRTLVAGQRYFFEVLHQEVVGYDHAAVAWQGPGLSRQVIANQYLEPAGTPSNRSLLRREIWSGISGNNVSDLTNNAAYPASPSDIGTLEEYAALRSPSNVDNNYGQRISGYLVAPETGRYTFWIASDDQSELWLSTNDNPANRRLIANVTSATAEFAWDAQANQESMLIPLVAGQRYYIETLHKEGPGDDFIAVAWQGPGFSRQLLKNPYLEHLHSIPGAPTLRREIWSSIAGSEIADLTSTSVYQTGIPDSRSLLTAFDAPRDFDDTYGQRVSAVLTAPESGNFRFWIASDDSSELWISPDTDRDHRVLIASAETFSDPLQWDKFPSQTSGVLPLVAGTKYYIEALQKEGNFGDHLTVAWEGPSFEREILDGRFLEYPGTPPPPSVLRREIWTGISGNTVANLTGDPDYPDNPDLVEGLDSFEAPQNWGGSYGQRISSFLIPAATGNYTFWIASDDHSELWLSTDIDPANRQKICEVTTAVNTFAWTSQGGQQSAEIPLVAGERYYIEALHKEGAVDDHLAVAWAGPDFELQIISSEYLEYPAGLIPGETQPGTPAAPNTLDPGYVFWLEIHSLSGADSLTTADPDNDGLPNGLEFVLGGNPTGATPNATELLPEFTSDGTWAYFIFRRSDVSAASAPRTEIGTNLTDDWSTAVDGVGNVSITVEDDGFGPDIDKVTVRVPMDTSRLFIRLASGS